MKILVDENIPLRTVQTLREKANEYTPEKVAMVELAEACFDLRYARPSTDSK